MNKLEEAEKRYPVGTRIIPLNLDLMIGHPFFTEISNKNFYIYRFRRCNDSIWVRTGEWSSVVYSDGVWAEIIQEAPSEELSIVYSESDMKLFSEWIIDQVWDKLYVGGKSTEQLLKQWTDERQI